MHKVHLVFSMKNYEKKLLGLVPPTLRFGGQGLAIGDWKLDCVEIGGN